jgi:hypothetical protein
MIMTHLRAPPAPEPALTRSCCAASVGLPLRLRSLPPLLLRYCTNTHKYTNIRHKVDKIANMILCHRPPQQRHIYCHISHSVVQSKSADLCLVRTSTPCWASSSANTALLAASDITVGTMSTSRALVLRRAPC